MPKQEDQDSRFVTTTVIPIIEKEVSKREIIREPSTEQMINCVKAVLEEINDTMVDDDYGTAFA